MKTDEAVQRLSEVIRRKHFAHATERTYCAWLRRYCDFLKGLWLHLDSNGSGQFRAGDFLPFPNCECLSVPLDDNAQILKQRMFDCFATQRETLAPFSRSSETFRRAPRYDFAQPAHAGKLYYENFRWGVTGAEWRSQAAAAARQLGISF